MTNQMSGETHDRIVDAAFTALARDGYEATTVKDIADEAGVAPGLVHYYFKSKEDLVVAALAKCCAEMARRPGPDPTAEALSRLAEFKLNLKRQDQVHRLFVEMLGLSLHNPAIASGVLAFIRQDRGLVETLVREVIGGRQEGSQMEPSALAAAIWAGVIGIIVQNLVDPDFEAEAAVDALTAMALR